MFEYIKGKLEHIDENFIVVEVNGLGYKIYTCSSDSRLFEKLNNEVKVYTYLHVKEDIFDLYGFTDKDKINIFKMLISVSGVGPKAALAILASVNTSDFALAIGTSDEKTLTKAQGVGKKLAQRIILELKDKIKSKTTENMEQIDNTQNYNIDINEAVNALIVLGYSAAEATTAVKRVDTTDLTIEEIIKKALKNAVN